MSKEIKYYLHLYLGCEAAICYDPKDKLNGMRIDQIVDVGLRGAFTSNGDLEDFEDIKPLLRPLSSMTEEEADQFVLMCLNSIHAPEDFIPIESDELQINLVHNDGGLMLDDNVEIYIEASCRCFDGYIAIMKDGRIGMADETDTPTDEMKPVDDVYGKVDWLRKKWFDTDNLIESGLAIDATTLKPLQP